MRYLIDACQGIFLSTLLFSFLSLLYGAAMIPFSFAPVAIVHIMMKIDEEARIIFWIAGPLCFGGHGGQRGVLISRRIRIYAIYSGIYIYLVGIIYCRISDHALSGR